MTDVLARIDTQISLRSVAVEGEHLTAVDRAGRLWGCYRGTWYLMPRPTDDDLLREEARITAQGGEK